MNTVTLNNGVKMPQFGLGVWQVPDEEAEAVVKKAIEVGYTGIDTASVYKNEVGVGKAVKQAKVNREDLFITSKVWNTDQGYDQTLAAFDASLERLGMDYLDLYLVHWPMPRFDTYIDTYKALEKLYKDGRVKAIGVSNFEIEHLQRLMQETEIKPVVNQVECHPYFAQNELKQFCKQQDIFVEAWSPLEQGGDVLKDDVVVKIAQKYGKTAAQVVLRWHLQNDTITIPKSVTPSRIEENFQVFDFELTEEDMKAINGLDQGLRRGGDPKEMHHK